MNYKENVKKLIDDNEDSLKELVYQKIDIWAEHIVFSWLWWFGLILSILPWVIWYMFRRRDSSNRILFAGFFVIIISLCLDVIGDQLGLWHYRFVVIPFLPTYIPWDLTLMPISIMFLIQIKPNLNPFIKAVIFALLSSYVGEPFFKWLGVYVLDEWKYSYSVPIQILIYLLAHYVSRRDHFSHLT